MQPPSYRPYTKKNSEKIKTKWCNMYMDSSQVPRPPPSKRQHNNHLRKKYTVKSFTQSLMIIKHLDLATQMK